MSEYSREPTSLEVRVAKAMTNDMTIDEIFEVAFIDNIKTILDYTDDELLAVKGHYLFGGLNE